MVDVGSEQTVSHNLYDMIWRLLHTVWFPSGGSGQQTCTQTEKKQLYT